MSFQSLVSGSECAVPSNPLSQVLKHTEGDRSLQQDRIAGPSGSRLHHLPGSSSAPLASEHDLIMARQFFETNGPGMPMSFVNRNHGPSFGIPASMIPGPEMQEAWKLQQGSSWAAEFIPDGPQNAAVQVQGNGIQNQVHPSESQIQRPYYNGTLSYSRGMGMGMGMGMPPTMYPGLLDQGKGKGKSREADFEAAFAQVAASLETPRIVEVQDGVSELEEALKNTDLDADGLANSDPDDMATWEAQFSQMMNETREDLDYDYGSAMQRAWEETGGSEGPATLKFTEEGIPVLPEYVFDTNNKFLDPSTSSSSPLNDAKALLEQNGSLSEAALLLEAAIQKGDLGEGGYEAWILLGETRNMDEREDIGMRALMEGVRLAETAGSSGAGMVSLAISYTNEAFERASYSTLLRWLRATHPEIPVSEETAQAVAKNSTWDIHGRVSELFLILARSQHSQNIVDPEVQTALGVLFYTNNEYDRATDCFSSALGAKPQDFLLWNRLGSALSNGSKPEEALGAYREALQLRPTYTRAIYNVGVACLNIGAHREAAEHFLSALALQETKAGGESSEQLWMTLRRAFFSMDRPDLAELAKPELRSNLDLFRKEGFEF
ncbi:hypothetical protein C8J56DRAFT_793879 [Mycena floridula]|nr:hypothetical protein C8J56DRAFT_793879 [Mycena floridula]